jgi:hypothetical protein
MKGKINMTTKTFVYDPSLGELAKEIKKAIADGQMTYLKGVEIMKKAIMESIANKAVEIKDDSVN